MAANTNGAANRPPSSLSPRQKFQAHIRTLSDTSPTGSRSRPRTASAETIRSPPELQHASSLRVQQRDSPPPRHPSRPKPADQYGASASASASASAAAGRPAADIVPPGPPLVADEREAWATPSPLRIRKRVSNDALVLQPPEEQHPPRQPRKHEVQPPGLRRPLPEKPSTAGQATPTAASGLDAQPWALADHDHGFFQSSRFAEGSMGARSAGIASSWAEHGSITSISGTESDDDDDNNNATPRGAPRPSLSDVADARAPPVTPATLKQRLRRVGSAFKPRESIAHDDLDARPAKKQKKKRALRKSISLWSLGSRARPADEGDSDRARQHGPPGPDAQNAEVRDDRMRGAEEAYAQQRGKRRRVSNFEQAAASKDQAVETVAAVNVVPPFSADEKTPEPPRSNGHRRQRLSATSIAADFVLPDKGNDIDHRKRPSRRELEKENQQLRAILRQQQEQSRAQATQSGRPSADTKTPSNALRQPSKQESSHPPAPKQIPPVPPIPDRVALRTLSNVRTQPQKKNPTSHNNKGNNVPVTSSVETESHAASHPPPDDVNDKMMMLRNTGIVGRSRPVSMILEEDEEMLENISPVASPHRANPHASPIDRVKVQQQILLSMKGVKREHWEWPDDVF